MNLQTRLRRLPGRDARQRWNAIQRRDTTLDGAFVYAVRSTGIYCRPSCPSRKPRRAQVLFFRGPDAAELAGFRECRRCQPRHFARTGRAAADPASATVALACRRIEANG